MSSGGLTYLIPRHAPLPLPRLRANASFILGCGASATARGCILYLGAAGSVERGPVRRAIPFGLFPHRYSCGCRLGFNFRLLPRGGPRGVATRRKSVRSPGTASGVWHHDHEAGALSPVPYQTATVAMMLTAQCWPITRQAIHKLIILMQLFLALLPRDAPTPPTQMCLKIGWIWIKIAEPHIE